MTLNNQIFNKYIEAKYIAKNYEIELEENIHNFFEARNIEAFAVELPDANRFILIEVRTEVDTDILKDAAVDFSKEFNVIFLSLTKELTTYFENNRVTGASVDEYRLFFKRKDMVA